MTSVSLAYKYITCLIRQALGSLNLVLFCFWLLSGCGERISEHGHTINQLELNTIEIGRTRKVDILETLGQPSFEGAFDSQKLYYVSHVMESPVAGINTTKARTIYTFTFDDNNLLQSILLTDKKSGIKVIHINEKTPIPGDTYGVIEQIMSNIRRGQAEE